MPAAKTTEHPNVYAALAAAQGEFPEIPKTKSSNAYGNKPYWYADIADILAVVRPVLSRHGLCVIQLPEHAGNTLTMTTRLHHASGGDHVEGMLSCSCRAEPQKIGSAITYLRRYGLGALLGVAPDDDEDGQAAQDSTPPPQRPQRPQRGGYDRPDHDSHDAKVTALRRLLSGSYGAKTPEEADALVRMVAGMSLDEAKTIPPATEKALAALRDWTHPEFTKATAVAEAMRLRAADAAEDTEEA